MKPKRRARRNVLIVSVLFLLAGLLVSLARLSPRADIPAETAEMAARRANRETNGFYLLEEMLKRMPAPPTPAWLPMPDDPGTEAYYDPPPGTLGYRVGVGRLDDDPALLEYVALAEPLSARVREVLAKPDMLPPPRVSDPENTRFGEAFEYSSFHQQLRNLLNLLVARAYTLSGRPETSGESAQLLRDVFELMLRMRDGGVGRMMHVKEPVFFETLARLQPRHQREMIDWALPLRRLVIPRERVEFDVRQHAIQLDRLKKYGSVLRPIEAAAYLRHRALFFRHIDYVYKVAELRHYEWRRLIHEDPLYRKLSTPELGLNLSAYCSNNTYWAYWMDSCVLVLAIELYRQENGTLPETLDQLTPDFLAAIPEDVFLAPGTPYRYELMEGGYRLTARDDAKHYSVNIKVPRGESEP